jgi:ssDNA-binding Zn-finger/Zn-ribbon topoisomerase 1
MKCPVCGIEMRLERVEDGKPVWICRNGKCRQSEKEEPREETDNGAD